MAEQYPQMDGLCDTACAYAARVRQFAEQRGVPFDDAMTELEERLEQVRWKVMPAGPQRQENCGTLDVPAEECRVLRLVQGIASCYGMTAQQYMESAYVDDFFSGVADGRSGTTVAISAAVEAAEEAGAQPTDDKELPGGGSGRKFLWELPESWKRLRLPAMTKNTRRFVLAFGLTLGVVLLIVAAAGIYRWGYNGAIAEKGTYDAGFAAAMAERGTYQEGYDAAIAEKEPMTTAIPPALPRAKPRATRRAMPQGMRTAPARDTMPDMIPVRRTRRRARRKRRRTHVCGCPSASVPDTTAHRTARWSSNRRK